jgi:hypothetical protein
VDHKSGSPATPRNVHSGITAEPNDSRLGVFVHLDKTADQTVGSSRVLNSCTLCGTGTADIDRYDCR